MKKSETSKKLTKLLSIALFIAKAGRRVEYSEIRDRFSWTSDTARHKLMMKLRKIPSLVQVTGQKYNFSYFCDMSDYVAYCERKRYTKRVNPSTGLPHPRTERKETMRQVVWAKSGEYSISVRDSMARSAFDYARVVSL